MPKSTPTPPKYRHHKPSGRAVVTLNGRDHYLGKWDSPESRVEYDRLVGEWLVRKDQCLPDEPGHDLEVTELVSRYWQFAQAYYRKNGKPTGVLPGIKVALRVLRQYYGHTQAAKFGPLALKALQQRMVDEGHRRGVTLFVKRANSHLTGRPLGLLSIRKARRNPGLQAV